ncbi:transcriptional regulatory protein AlgP-like [Frankliniella occidentalis]|uniref:Transcriptional regulatory protein AlgP-like n=1 Tax=Frankliniella occidentalis TaxID=133901 RepID=A0A9C6TSB4_FRAOC|nr:transcriptional regulatory protein AlgP-like [Frankliniella occidentalis]
MRRRSGRGQEWRRPVGELSDSEETPIPSPRPWLIGQRWDEPRELPAPPAEETPAPKRARSQDDEVTGAEEPEIINIAKLMSEVLSAARRRKGIMAEKLKLVEVLHEKVDEVRQAADALENLESGMTAGEVLKKLVAESEELELEASDVDEESLLKEAESAENGATLASGGGPGQVARVQEGSRDSSLSPTRPSRDRRDSLASDLDALDIAADEVMEGISPNVHILLSDTPRDQVPPQPPAPAAAAAPAVAVAGPSSAKRQMQVPPAAGPKRRRKQRKPLAAPQGKPPTAPKGKRPQPQQQQPPQRKPPQQPRGKPQGKQPKQQPTYEQLKVQLTSALASARHASERATRLETEVRDLRQRLAAAPSASQAWVPQLVPGYVPQMPQMPMPMQPMQPMQMPCMQLPMTGYPPLPTPQWRFG